MDARVLFAFLLGCLIGGGAVFGVHYKRWSEQPAAAVREEAKRPASAPAEPVAQRTVVCTEVVDAVPDPVEAEPEASIQSEPAVVEIMPADPPEPTAVARRMLARQASAATNLEFLENVDITHLDAGGARTHKAYLEALRLREALRLAVNEARLAGETVTEEDALALRRAEAAVNEQAAAERHVLFAAAARAMGYEERAAEEFALTLWSVVTATAGN